jgi:hypothetical protein
MTMNVPGLSHPVTMTGSGYQDLRKRNGVFSFDLSSLAAQSQGQIPAGAKMEEIFAYPSIYMRSPLFGKAVAAGKWMKVDLRAAGRRMGVNFDSLMQSDPTQYLRYLRVAGEDVKRVGTASVRGVQTTHYTANLNLHKTPNFYPPARRAAARQAVERVISLAGTDHYPVAVWIDSRKMIRRLSMSMNMKIQGRPMKMDMTIDLFNFGRKPAVKAPPKKDVVAAPLSGAQTGP